ncbi:hypothetical protein K435DRAFT_847225 [Dendrothele bispora CBS 962.96]|uniref:Yeast cell wall synthesis Kre9/Knh1-like N-terminal domain-containing protein n=1 Tax=Dendrothele bispora (strain CBS 962.96) TaxID=1314807 RepID=A0A4S8MYI6_DENBC|nr:hypothetical protein K435DRAFT_847225 [Dendrothele bispora CBS 962.96]
MRSFVTLCLALASSSWAYQVTRPSPSQGWTNSGSQTVTWDMVSTDPSNFTILLTNTDRNVLPINNQVLTASVEGSLGTIDVRPPSGGWIAGPTYRVNLVKSENELSSIYAQSDEFDITESTSSSSATTIPAATLPNGQSASRTTMVASNTAPSGSSNSASATADGPTTPSNAAVSINAQSGLAVALLALFATVMA